MMIVDKATKINLKSAEWFMIINWNIRENNSNSRHQREKIFSEFLFSLFFPWLLFGLFFFFIHAILLICYSTHEYNGLQV